MNKLTALKAIEEATAYLKSLETPVTIPQPADMPKAGEVYYWIRPDGEINFSSYFLITSEIDYKRYEYGNCYLTKEDAEKAAAKQLATMRVLRKLRELEGDFVADLSNIYQDKYSVYFDCSVNELLFSVFRTVMYAPADWYSTKEAYEYIIENMASDLKLMYGIKL